MQAIPFTYDDVRQAQTSAKKMGLLRHNQNGMLSVLTGKLGELVFYNYIQQFVNDVQLADTRDYDIVANGIRLEVKTRRCQNKPKKEYLNFVSAHNCTQNCDAYVFLRLKYNANVLAHDRNVTDCSRAGTVWFAGAITKDEFLCNSTFASKHTQIQKIKIKFDCYYVPMTACHSYKALTNLLLQNKDRDDDDIFTETKLSKRALAEFLFLH